MGLRLCRGQGGRWPVGTRGNAVSDRAIPDDVFDVALKLSDGRVLRRTYRALGRVLVTVEDGVRREFERVHTLATGTIVYEEIEG